MSLLGGSGLPAIVQLDKDVENLVVDVRDLVTRGGFHEVITLEEPKEQALDLVTTDYAGRTFEINMDKVWQCLLRSEVTTIGVWGMGGVGKTTLVEHIYNKVLENRSFFGGAYWVTVSKDCTILKLQCDIAKRVNKYLYEDLVNENDEKIRAAKLARYFESEEKFVLFLDDMWDYFDIRMLGIQTRGGRKVILTTREMGVS